MLVKSCLLGSLPSSSVRTSGAAVHCEGFPVAGPGEPDGGDCWGDFEALCLPGELAGAWFGGELGVDMAGSEGSVEERA